MSLLICGANGQLGRELSLRAGDDAIALDRSALDIRDADAVLRAIEQHRPRVVINAAAYTAVDKAESERESAEAINRDGAENLARACERHGAALLHVSTDYVFDGSGARAWRETDTPAPLGIYGDSKWQGEQRVAAACTRHLILRVSWLFGAHGANFVKTMLRLARERPELRVVADQHGKPTPAADFAQALLALAQRIADGEMLPWGTYHYAGEPATTWHGFAEAIVSEAQQLGLIDHAPRVSAIATRDYPTPAQRPVNSILDTTRTQAALGLRMPDWRDGLRDVLRTLKTA